MTLTFNVSRLLALLTLGAVSVAHSQETPIDTPRWGMYSQLVGTQAEAPGGYRLRWSWAQPGVEILEDWITPSTGKLLYTVNITLGAEPNQFRVKGIGGKVWNGTQQADGSIVYVGEGLLKMPYGVSLNAEGTYVYLDVKVRDGKVESLKPKSGQQYRFARIDVPGSAPPAMSADPAHATLAATPATSPAPVGAPASAPAAAPIAVAPPAVQAQPSASPGGSLEQTYASMCAGDVRNETCDALRKAMLEKLSNPTAPASSAAPSAATPDPARLAAWGMVGRQAANGTELMITESLSNETKFSNYIYGAMLFEYTWISDTVLKKKSTQLEATSYSWGYGARGEASPVPASALSCFEETMTLNAADAKIDIVQRFTCGSLNGSEHKYQADVNPATNYGKPSLTQYGINGQTHYTEVTYQGDNYQVESGKLEGGSRVPTSYGRLFKVHGMSRTNIDAMIAGERQKFYTTISAFHQKQPKSDGWLRALIGAGVGLAAGDAYGLDSTQTLGAVMKGIQITGEGSAATNALGSMGDQLIAGPAPAGAGVPSGASGADRTPKENLASGACAGFSESNYRTKALEGGGDSQLNTMCGQAFEYYVMYKRALSQGYSVHEAEKTYQAHAQSARVASSFLDSHRAN